MKKIISFICMIALICTLVAPLYPIQVSAAAKDDWYKQSTSAWSVSGGAKRMPDGSVYLPDGAPMLQARALYADKFTVSFSYMIETASNSLGVQVHFEGHNRAGYYIQSGAVSIFGGGQAISVPNESGWHDYRIEIDYTTNIQSVYFDDEFVGTQELRDEGWETAAVYFWAANGGTAFVNDVHISTNEDSIYFAPDELKLTKEYTEPFFQDWNEIGGWRVEQAPFVTHYPEEGLIKLSTTFGENLTYRSIERPLRPPTNFDMEFRARFPELPEHMNPGNTKFQISTGNRHAWITFRTGTKIVFNNYSMDGEDPLYEGPQNALPYTYGHDWFTLKAEVRGDSIEWFIDGKKLVSRYKINTAANNVWHVSIFSQQASTLSNEVMLDWVKYTPYFEDELKITAPIGNSEFAAGGDIEIKAETPSGAEKIDYYINGVYVGSGYKSNGYVYTLKNAKVGTYSLTAKIENIETGDYCFVVKPGMTASVSLDKESIKYGETVVATVKAESVTANDKATKAEFFIDGKLVATDTTAPFSATLSGFRVGTGAVSAKVYNENGMVVTTDNALVTVDYVKESELDVGREYEVNYSYKEGDGSFYLHDGYFTLSMKHTKDGVTYKTMDGEKTYEGIGYGDYKIVVDSGHADVYWKNQYLESVILPYEPTYKPTTTDSGLSDVSIKGSGVKAQLFSGEWKGEAFYDSGALPETKYYAIEFDKTDTSPEEFYFCDGTFASTISFREDGVYAMRDLTLTHGHKTEDKLADSFEPGYYRLTVGLGIAQLTCNNKNVGWFRAMLQGGKTQITRKMSNPKASTFVAFKNSDDVFYYKETFEGDTEYPYTEYWMKKAENYRLSPSLSLETEVKTDSRTGNHYMSLSGSGVLLANAIDNHPSIKWRGMAEKASGKFYVQMRRSYGDARTRVGYDFDNGEWFMEIRDGENGLKFSDTKPAKDAVSAGKWYDYELVTEGLNITVLQNGKEVYSVDLRNDLKIIWYGRMGMGVENGGYAFDDFEYVGKNRVVPGGTYSFTHEWTTDGNYKAPFGYYEKREGVVSTYGTSEMESTDGGKTWKVGSGPSIGTAQFTIMPDGTWVRVTGEGTGFVSQISKDQGATWSEKYPFGDGWFVGAGSRLMCTMDGRLFYPGTRGDEDFGRQIVFYSDDGITWHQSETEVNTFNTGVVMNEAMCVDTPRENEIWMLCRSNTGFIAYFISYDNGKTFDLTPHNLGLPHTQCCYRVVRDWENPNTYYAVFNSDTQTADFQWIQQPRNRLALAVSYDGMKSWEFIADLMEANDEPTLHTSDFMMNYINGVIYWRATNYQHNLPGCVIGAQDITKMKTLKRYPQLHYRLFQGYDVVATGAQDHCVIPKISGEAWIYGDYYQVLAKDGRYDLATIEKVFGVTATKSGSAVTLNMGEGKVTFTENSATYDVNGTAATAETPVLVDGYLDIKTLAEIYGKVINETEDSYSVLYKAPSIDMFQLSIDNLA